MESFESKVQEIKNHAFDKNIDKFREKIGFSYLERKESIDLKNLRSYLKQTGNTEEQIALLFPNIELKSGAILEEFESILNPNQIKSPEYIAMKIGEYVSQKMSYDFIVGQGLQAKKIRDYKDRYFQESLLEIENRSKQYQDLSDHQITQIKNMILNTNLSTETDTDIAEFISEARQAITDGVDLKDYIFGLITNGNLMGFLKSSLKEQLNINPDKTTVEEMLNGIKVGVCRHFSIIAKEIYQNMKEKYPQELSNSELLVAVDIINMHMYNKLMFQQSNGELKEKIIDITNLLTNGNSEPMIPPSEELILATHLDGFKKNITG